VNSLYVAGEGGGGGRYLTKFIINFVMETDSHLISSVTVIDSYLIGIQLAP
jgi:hypothetical protein